MIETSNNGSRPWPSFGPRSPSRARKMHGSSITIFVIILVIFGMLSYLSYASNQRNNQRLLSLRTNAIGSLLAAVLPVVQTPLASAVELADVTGGNPQQFKTFIAQDVGSGKLFSSASLWSLKTRSPIRVAVVGSPLIGTFTTNLATLIDRSKQTSSLASNLVTNKSNSDIDYAFTGVGTTHLYAVVAQSPLPPHRIAGVHQNSLFDNLDFAIYLGQTENRTSLLEATTLRLPIQGPNSTAIVPFGSSSLTVVASAATELSGTISTDSWWVVALLGIAMALSAASASERLIRRRLSAEDTTLEIERLYAEQRNVAITLQQALLPNKFPALLGVEVRTRYVPGVEGLEIGGDWYDALELSDDRILLIIGDVSGRGLRAATIMASLHYAIRAYALQGDSPDTIFAKLANIVDIRRDHHFATVLCALVDTKNNEVTFVSAGHPPPLMRMGDQTDFVLVPVGPPIGIPGSHEYKSVSVAITDNVTLLGYTDGLIERRGEHLDLGLARLRDVVANSDLDEPLDDLLGDIIAELTPSGPVDDVALLGLRWHI